MKNSNSFQDIVIKHSYSNLETDILQEIVEPLLKRSISYHRAVGFFTSGWLKKVIKSLLIFVKNGGKAKIITSIHLSENDWDAILSAHKERQNRLIVQKTIENAFDELENLMEHDTLSALSWLVRDEILEFRFAIPLSELDGGIFHSKFSVFNDFNGNGVVLHGSQNDSAQATINEETVSAFTSWGPGNIWYDDYKKRFHQMWNNEYSNLNTLKIDEAEKNIIIRKTLKYDRPYTLPEKKATDPTNLTLRDYQEKAIAAWEKNGRRGIFEMATGTGKTFTAISAAVNVYKKEERLALIVLVPYIHLVDQWVEELVLVGFQPILCYENLNKWKINAATKIREFNAKLVKHICLVSTHQTSSMETFRKIAQRLHEPFLLVGDEIHELGAPNYRKALLDKATWRIGLSATPDRWYDEKGTSVLRSYFGKTVIHYELKKAIKEDALTPYHYYPVRIDLNEYEVDDYKKISKTIAQEYSKKKSDPKKIEHLLRKRADLLGRAQNKIPHLIQLLNSHKIASETEGKKFQHLLFYCNKGTHREVLSAVSEGGLKVHEFVHDVPLKDRKKVLEAFGEGKIDGLVAIKCLDQGVDVPATRQAYILASSTNPREFVQRRGRILRKSADKNYASIYDFVVGPWNTIPLLGVDVAKKLLLRELPRFAEFSLDAQNSQEARNEIWDWIERLDLVSSIRKRPWEVYKGLLDNKI